jgi:hypothetical protein
LQTGTGKAQRQRSIVQGRITNGTLFPNISTSIQENVEKLNQTSFLALHDRLQATIDLVKTDLDMALALRVPDECESRNQEIGRSSADLLREVGELRTRHEELLDSIRQY